MNPVVVLVRCLDPDDASEYTVALVLDRYDDPLPYRALHDFREHEPFWRRRARVPGDDPILGVTLARRLEQKWP